MPLGEPAVGPPGAPIRHLNRAEQLLLEPIRGALGEQLIRAAQRRQRGGDVVDRAGERVEHLLSRVSRDVRHRARVATTHGSTFSDAICTPRSSSSTSKTPPIFAGNSKFTEPPAWTGL